jgi:hypothetical protein
MTLWTHLDPVGIKLDGYEFDREGNPMNDKAREMVRSIQEYLPCDHGVMHTTDDHEWYFYKDGSLLSVSER